MREVSVGPYTISAGYTYNEIPAKQIAINTINAYSWVMADKDPVFREALQSGDYLLPDGIAVVWAARFLSAERIDKIAGADLHKMVLDTLNRIGGKCFYLGASETTLSLIRERIARDYPNILVGTYSPPFKPEFSETDNEEMIRVINEYSPDALFVGMTAPKQEKWIFTHRKKLHTSTICAIGAVFDFYAETSKRPPQWMIRMGLEWFGRLISNPRRMWKRYIIYNPVFVGKIMRIKFRSSKKDR